MKKNPKRPVKLPLLEKKLEKNYGRCNPNDNKNPVDILISTILSQNTSDNNSSRAFNDLKIVFPEWEQVRNASLRKIERAVKSGGLARIKAEYIKNALIKIQEDFGSIELESLRKQTIAESLKYLAGFQGVGEKTAACLLLFGFGKRIMPVDTHVHRVTMRLGLVPLNSAREKSFQFWFGKNCIVDYYNLHLNLVRHGREICRARKPLCVQCVLKTDCVYFRDNRL